MLKRSRGLCVREPDRDWPYTYCSSEIFKTHYKHKQCHGDLKKKKTNQKKSNKQVIAVLKLERFLFKRFGIAAFHV